MIRQFKETVDPMHVRFIEPSKNYADIVVSGLEDVEANARKILLTLEKQGILGEMEA